MKPLNSSEEVLNDWFSACPGALIAFSGGVDSSLVAWLAHRFLGRDRMLAVISASASLKLSELEAGKSFCWEHGIPLKVIRTAELLNPDYFSNPANRCYFCKTTLYEELATLRLAYPGYWILNGTNRDDLGDYRPGLNAAKEYAVRSPLEECGLDKDGVRRLAQGYGLVCWDKPASPCLSSRIPYGERVTEAKLRRIELAEEWLSAQGFSQCRVRHMGETARIEVPASELVALPPLSEIESFMIGIGFQGVEVDGEGFVSGKLNRALV